MRTTTSAAKFQVIERDGSIVGDFPLPARSTSSSWRELVRVLKETFLKIGAESDFSYAVPAKDPSLGPADLSFIAYRRLEPKILEMVMTDIDGKRQQHTVAAHRLTPKAEAWLCADLESYLAPQFQEVVSGSKDLIVQANSDLLAPKCSFFNGRVLLVGDAAAVSRPHAFASTSKAAFEAFRLKDLIEGVIGVDEWERDCLAFSEVCVRTSKQVGGILLSEGEEKGLQRFGAQNLCLMEMHKVTGKLNQGLGSSWDGL